VPRLGAEVGVTHGHLDVRVPQEFLHLLHACATHLEVDGAARASPDANREGPTGLIEASHLDGMRCHYSAPQAMHESPRAQSQNNAQSGEHVEKLCCGS
jgi:hypothetical protein